MSEPASCSIKNVPKDVPGKQPGAENSSFSNLSEEGFPAGPSLKSPTPADYTASLSDDEPKTLTTLEPVKKHEGVVEKKSVPAATAAAAAASKTIPKSSNSASSLPVRNETVKPNKTPDKDTHPSESIIEKMRNKLSKHIERKSLNSTPASPPLDMSGAIEIPQDLILSNDIPQTPIAAPDSKESKLDDHDLIAILEGNVVAIRENASEIEVCVGSDETKDSGGGEMEILSFSIINPDELQQAKKEREMEIARRQMESLPTMPKVRRPRIKTMPRKADSLKQTEERLWPIEVKESVAAPAAKEIKLPPGVTIKGQTTIRPLVKIPLDSGLPIKKEQQQSAEAVKAMISKNLKEKLSKDMKAVSVTVKKSVSKLDVSQPKKSQLVDSLVSDWDDEPGSGQRPDEVDGMLAPQTQENPMPTIVPLNAKLQDTDPPEDQNQFILPVAPAAEPKRAIKRKIIWDPSDSTVPFASLVKSKRAQSANIKADQNPPPGLAPLRRKRADSVAVRMIDGTPQFSTIGPVRQRAKTPELGQMIVRQVPPKVEELVNDPKAKKRKKNEIERLLGDEGAINMLYDVECETNRKDLLKETEVDTSDEDEKLLAKTKIITDAVINQGKSPNESSAQGLRIRTKRSTTPMGQAGTVTTTSPQQQHSTKASSSSPSSVTSVTAEAMKKPSSNGTATTANVPPITGARKRKMTATAAREWEYVYNAQRNDDAMIIRRRSNSSYSSGAASPRRLSFDQTNEPAAGFGSENSSTSPQNATHEQPAANRKQKDGAFPFAKPPAKNESQSKGTKASGATTSEEIKFNPSLVANMRGKLTKVLKGMKGAVPLATSTPGQDVPVQNAKKQPIKRKAPPALSSVDVVDSSDASTIAKSPTANEADLEKQLDQLKQISCVKQHGNYAEIVLAAKGIENRDAGDPLMDVFSFDLLTGLTNMLTMLQRDESVRAVLIRSSGAHFSRGIDVGHLIQPIEKRPEIVESMSVCLMKFLKALIGFTKPIVAAVHGDVLGMGVTILPLFDLVVAQMGSSFTAPYGHFGYLPEGIGAFTSCRTLKGKTVADLFLLGKRLTATVALDYGLVTETVPPERFEERARSVARTVANQSVQAMQTIKRHLRRDLVTKMGSLLMMEQKRQAEQWCTAECQQKFKLFVSKGGEL
ncbi:uncharacterized protein LOC126561472 [Anopheles maculipalpis]|uniref:uncharacterized protein LOC126561472 n=1 Tax=Anopheles maculipalpis TaxID=1496333 RepID=UPI002158EDC6|nr:uncharacterized protein LOC126561472 [Anopheles maculipalpis]